MAVQPLHVVYVHGFGGPRGALERALADAARTGGDEGLPRFLPVRWPAGDLREMRARAVVEVARKVAEKRSLARGIVEAAVEGARRTSAAWDQAVANIPAGAAALADTLVALGDAPVAVLAFSLGCRAVLHPVAVEALAGASLVRVVFAGSAAPRAAYEAAPGLLGRGVPLQHVYSSKDAVLDRLLPLGKASQPPSGRAPLALPGVEDLEVAVGHRGYPSIAAGLWSLARGGPLVAPAALAHRGNGG